MQLYLTIIVKNNQRECIRIIKHIHLVCCRWGESKCLVPLNDHVVDRTEDETGSGVDGGGRGDSEVVVFNCEIS